MPDCWGRQPSELFEHGMSEVVRLNADVTRAWFCGVPMNLLTAGKMPGHDLDFLAAHGIEMPNFATIVGERL
jgi:hypothetical protein